MITYFFIAPEDRVQNTFDLFKFRSVWIFFGSKCISIEQRRAKTAIGYD